jgi:hypothetical protein
MLQGTVLRLQAENERTKVRMKHGFYKYKAEMPTAQL